MKLKDVRKLGIKYCEENKSRYTFISYTDNDGFYLREKEGKHTVFLVNRNGSLDAYLNTSYAVEFHKELKRRKNNRRGNGKNGKKEFAEMCNSDCDESGV